MSDFVADYRPQALRFPPIQPPSGFVAEVRRSSYQPHPPISSSPEMTRKPDFFKGNVHSDYEVAFNEVLSQKLVSKDTLREVTKKSIVQLLQTLLSGSRLTKIQGFINVSTVESDGALCLELNETYQVKRNTPVCHDGADLDDGLTFKVGKKICCRENLDPVDHYHSRVAVPLEAPSGGMLEDRGYLSPSSELSVENNLDELPRHRRYSEVSEKTDSSEEESGYSSNERDSVSDEGGEEMADDRVNGVQQTPPYGERVESCQGIHSEDTDCDEECGLVIDLCVSSVDSSNGEQAEMAQRTNRAEESYTKPKLWSLLDTKSDEGDKCVEINQDTRQQVSRDEPMTRVPIVDGFERHVEISTSDYGLDVPMDLSGDKIETIIPEWTEQEKQIPDTTTSVELPCKKCPTILPDIGSYKEHALQFHQLHACVTCFKDFSSKNNLKRHDRIHTGSRPYKCGQCEMSFARRDDLKGHTLRHDYNKPFRCSLCRKGYTDRACVKNHMLKEHCSRLMQICPECGESFDRDDVFLEHKKSHPSLQQFACDTCQYIGTNHLMALKHKLLHSFKLFSCKPCNAYFADPFAYTKHVRKHKKTPEFTFYVCCFCDSVLPTYDQYVRHEYSHAQGKPHECNVCKKQFKSKTSMLEHSFVHSNPMASTAPETVTNNQVEVTEMDCNENDSIGSPCPDHSKTSSEFQVCQSLPMNHAITPPRHANDKIGNSQDPIQDILLDLSLKSQSSEVSRSKEFSGVDKTERTPVVLDISSPRMLSLSNPCVPRNGCAAIETRVQEQEKSVQDCGSVVSQTNSDDEKFKIVWQSPAYHNNVPMEERENMSERGKTNLRSILTCQEMQRERSKSETEETERKHVGKIRFHPYSRDFASKFLAARGGKFLKEIGNTQTGILIKKESIATAATPMSLELLKARGQKPVTTSSDTFQKSSSGEEAKLCQPTPLSTVIGLSGKPCLARSSVEEPINDDKTRNDSPALKSELIDEDLTPTSTTDHQPITSSPFSEDRNECGICRTNFKSFDQLESHSVNEHKRYLCEYCKRTFTARPNRDRHLRFHTGERPYKCDLCPSAFMRGDDLKNHRTRHRSEQINCDKCSASFSGQKDLEKHLRHSGCVV